MALSQLTATPTSQVAGITGMCHHTQLIFLFIVETGFPYVGQAGLELLTSDDLPTSVSQSAWIIGMSNRARPCGFLYTICMAFLPIEHSLACVRAYYHLDLLLFTLCQMLFMDGEFVLILLPTALPSV